MADKSHPIKWYIENNDFEGAVERFENTTPTWKSRWYEACEKIYNSCKKWTNDWVLNPIEKTIKKIQKLVTKRTTKLTNCILIAEDCPSLLDEVKQKCYLFEFLDENDNLICSKIGTTTRGVRQRLTEELRSKTYKNMGACKAIIHRVYDCKDLPAEGLESYFRAKYIKKYPNSFKKNDRFMNLNFDLKQADKIYEKYIKST